MRLVYTAGTPSSVPRRREPSVVLSIDAGSSPARGRRGHVTHLHDPRLAVDLHSTLRRIAAPYRHLSTPATIADAIGAPGRATRTTPGERSDGARAFSSILAERFASGPCRREFLAGSPGLRRRRHRAVTWKCLADARTGQHLLPRHRPDTQSRSGCQPPTMNASGTSQRSLPMRRLCRSPRLSPRKSRRPSGSLTPAPDGAAHLEQDRAGSAVVSATASLTAGWPRRPSPWPPPSRRTARSDTRRREGARTRIAAPPRSS